MTEHHKVLSLNSRITSWQPVSFAPEDFPDEIAELLAEAHKLGPVNFERMPKDGISEDDCAFYTVKGIPVRAVRQYLPAIQFNDEMLTGWRVRFDVLYEPLHVGIDR